MFVSCRELTMRKYFHKLMCNSDVNKIRKTDDWKNKFAGGANQEAAAAAPPFPIGTQPSDLSGHVFYVKWIDEKTKVATYWFGMIADVRRNEGQFRLLIPNEKTKKERVTSWLDRKDHIQSWSIVGQNDVQRVTFST